MSTSSITTPSQSIGSAVFAIVAGAIGLVVDVVALIALITGAVDLPSGSLLAESPVALGLITLFSLLYSLLLVLVFLRVLFRRRWVDQGSLLTEDGEEQAIASLAYLLWIPLFWLWSIVAWRTGEAAGILGIYGFFFAVFWILAMPMGGILLVRISGSIDLALNPSSNLLIQEARQRR